MLDPFAGSGTTLVAAANLKRSFIGFDISKKYQGMFQQRLVNPNSKIHLWEQMFVVEEILDRRIINGCSEYLLKWKGFDHDQNTVSTVCFTCFVLQHENKGKMSHELNVNWEENNRSECGYLRIVN